jgi:hypothetical protein
MQNLKNLFVIRHFVYVLLYIFCFAINKLNAFYTIIGKERIWIKESIVINLSTGFIMFFIRASETNFYWRLTCKSRGKGGNSDMSIDEKDPTTVINIYINI